VGSYALIGLITWIIIFIYFIWRVIARRNVVHLALSRFIVDPDAETQVVIEGRETGLMQWLLVQFKLGNKYRIHVRKKYISYSADSASGEELIFTPLQKISSTSCGYRRPIWLLITAAIVFIVGFIIACVSSFGIILLFILISAILAVIYYFGKSFFISINTEGSVKLKLSFKRSLIENTSVNIEKVKEAIQRINALLLEVQ
jgi:hypothetical protein